jgi:DNA-binding transcriptional ArsR family regulator
MAIRGSSEEGTDPMSAVARRAEVTPESLRADAEREREESARLRRESVKAMARAHALDREADALEQAAAIAADEWEPSPRAELCGRIIRHLEHGRTRQKSAAAIAAYLDADPAEVRSALALAIQMGAVKRLGLNRGTQYAAAHKVSDETPDPFGRTWLERVRDVAVELQTFSLKDACEALPSLAENTVRRHLSTLEDDGLLETAKDGTRLIFAYVPPPEDARTMPRASSEGAESRESSGGVTAIPGTGNARGAGRQEVRDLIRRARAIPGVEVTERKHSYLVTRDGKPAGAIPKTTSDHRAYRNVLSELANNGVNL